MKERKAFLARVAIILAILILSSCSGKNIVGPDMNNQPILISESNNGADDSIMDDIGWLTPINKGDDVCNKCGGTDNSDDIGWADPHCNGVNIKPGDTNQKTDNHKD